MSFAQAVLLLHLLVPLAAQPPGNSARGQDDPAPARTTPEAEQAPGEAPGPATEAALPPFLVETTAPRGVTLDEATAAAAAAYSEIAAGRALLVLRGGRTVFESYARGWDEDRPHALASGTKSFAGVLALAAIEDGLIESLDAPARTWIREWEGVEHKHDITVRHLLELSSGLAGNDPALGRPGYGITDLGPVAALAQRLRRRETPPDDRFAAAVQVPSVGAPGESFDYGPTHFYAFGALLERALRASDRPERSVFDYLRERVLLPAGVDVGLDRFAPDADDKPNLPGGGHLTAREWARFGAWILRGGAHRNGEGQLVRDLEEGALEPCFVSSATNLCYGLTFWLLNGAPGSTPDVADGFLADLLRPSAGQTARILDQGGNAIPIAMAAGAGKQRLYLIPSLDLVVVRFAEQSRDGRRFDDTVFLRLLLGLGAE